jgi:hypothetical protein
MNVRRFDHTATLLPSGQVLVAGGLASGAALASAEVYDPLSGRWTLTGSLRTARSQHTTTLLPSGIVLVAGGADGNGNGLASAELYDPASGRWTTTGAMSMPRVDHTATLLPSGQVLVVGGCNASSAGCSVLGSAERYDPASGEWKPAGTLATARLDHTATLLPSGQVLVAGGCGESLQTACIASVLASAERYDHGLGFEEAWRPNLVSVLPVAIGGAVGVEGSFFRGLGEASGGNSTQQSASNYPLLQIRRADSEQTRFLQVDPLAGWSDSTFTSLPLIDFPPGPALVTVFANAIPSIAQPVVVSAATLTCPPPGCEHPAAEVRLDRVSVSPRRINFGESVELATTLTAGNTAVYDLIVRFYDGDPKHNGQLLETERIPHLPAHASHELRVSFTPAECGTHRVIVVAAQGLPIEEQRKSASFRVDCRKEEIAR